MIENNTASPHPLSNLLHGQLAHCVGGHTHCMGRRTRRASPLAGAPGFFRQADFCQNTNVWAGIPGLDNL